MVVPSASVRIAPNAEGGPRIQADQLRTMRAGTRNGLLAAMVGIGSLPACGMPGSVPAWRTPEGRMAAAPEPIVWSLSEMIRIGPTARPSSPQPVRLEAARNETVAFQIVVTAPVGGLSNVGIRAGQFAPASHATLPIRMSVYREYFVDVPAASPVYGRPKSLGAGIYPDGLIPFVDDFTGKSPRPSPLRGQPVSIAAGHSQPYWIDVEVPAGTAPGNYAAALSVTGSRVPVTIPVKLHVWHVTMPLVPSVDSDFQIYYEKDRSLATQEEMLRHRIQPFPVSTPEEPALSRRFGLKMAGLGFWSGAYYGHCVMSGPPPASAIDRAADAQTVRFVYDQAADEIGSCKNFKSTLVPIMKRWAANLHAAGVLNMLTMQPVPELEEDGTGRAAVDIWTMLPEEYTKSAAAVRAVLAQGYRAWWYTALSQDTYSPKWEIDVPPADYRIEALIDASLSLTGEVYWAVDIWHGDGWNDVEYRSGGQSFAGEGILLYPGDEVGTAGAAPSMRLKWIRDGMYDADEVALLASCGLGRWALQQTRTIARDFHHWTENPNAIAAVHRRLAKRLDSSCPS
jgi:hypothetical protein